MLLHFERWGNSGPHLVFLHGMGGVGAMWRPHASKLENSTIITAPDQAGHGKSRPVSQKLTPQILAQDVWSTLEKIGGPFPLTVVGHSMGARTAVALGGIAPLGAITRIVLLDLGMSGSSGGGFGEGLAVFLEELPAKFATRAEAKEFLEKNAPDLSIARYLLAVATIAAPPGKTELEFPFDPTPLIQMIRSAKDFPMREEVRKCAEKGIEVYAIRGELSPIWKMDEYQRDTEALSDLSNVHFETWEGTGHGLPFEKREKLVEFLLSLQ